MAAVAAATAPAALPNTTILNILSNASFATKDTLGNTVVTLGPDYASNTAILSPFANASTGTTGLSVTNPPGGAFTFNVQSGAPANEQLQQAITGFAAAVSQLAGIALPRQLQIQYYLNAKSSTYVVTVVAI